MASPDDRIDPLDAPLRGAPASAGFSPRLRALGAVAAMVVAGGAAAALIWRAPAGPPGGRAEATAAIETPPPPAPPPAAPAQTAAFGGAPSASGASPSFGGQSQLPKSAAAELEEQSGVRVHRPRGTGAPGALIIQVPETPATLRLAPAPDKRLVEAGPHGPLPKVAGDGSRPAEVYARPLMMGGQIKSGSPRIALYVGGLGLAAEATEKATRLPGAVTLAFAPYGGNLARDVAQAREAGHEVLLQVPMEPLDYPANDPGQHTLLASDPAKNLDRLAWHMSRFPGYVGVANFLGGRFLSDEAALSPVLKDIGKRGLIYVEDAAQRSVAARLGASLKAPVLRADVSIDRADNPQAIEAGLAELERIARARGLAVGSASALPTTLERLQRWTNGLEAKGVALVPISAAAQGASLATAGTGR
ncbi:MAG: divergent polysaccharide deacetylase family protein [Rhizobiales bacterium]|nr:divergent polysaccharide deacetylase family protein [Hyphomicrobiales bacterium]